jgi:hypothetical protein
MEQSFSVFSLMDPKFISSSPQEQRAPEPTQPPANHHKEHPPPIAEEHEENHTISEEELHAPSDHNNNHSTGSMSTITFNSYHYDPAAFQREQQPYGQQDADFFPVDMEDGVPPKATDAGADAKEGHFDDEEESLALSAAFSMSQADEESSIDLAEEQEKQVKKTLFFAFLSAIGVIALGGLISKLIGKCFKKSNDDDAAGEMLAEEAGDTAGDATGAMMQQGAMDASQAALQQSTSNLGGFVYVPGGEASSGYVCLVCVEHLLDAPP